MPRLFLACSLALLPACNVVVLADDTEGGSTTDAMTTTSDVPTSGAADATGDPIDEAGACDFAGTIQPIFTASCGCHGGSQPAQGLSLAEGSAFAALVGVASAQQPETSRVQAGAPDASYLLHKLDGSATVGERMPIGGMLPADQIDVIAAWIAAGAPEQATFTCAGGAGGDVGDVEIDVAGPIQVQVGEIVEVDALVTSAEGESMPAAALTWSSSVERALYVDGTGALLGVSPGTAELRAHSGGVDSAPVSVEVIAYDPPAAMFTEVLKLTDARCAVAGCHVDGVEPGDLRFDRDREDIHEELLADGAEEVDGLARVEPDAPEASYLVHKLVERTPAVGAQMPIGGAPMAASEVQVIVRWILAGARND